jgi:hypothetical protein
VRFKLFAAIWAGYPFWDVTSHSRRIDISKCSLFAKEKLILQGTVARMGIFIFKDTI